MLADLLGPHKWLGWTWVVVAAAAVVLLTTSYEGYRALTLWRPWGLLTVDERIPSPPGRKTPENRDTLHPSWRGELFIHSGKTWDPDGEAVMRSLGLCLTESEVATGYIGLVTLVDVHDASDPDCRCDPFWARPYAWHLVLANPRPFRFAYPEPGQRGLFKPNPIVVDMLPQLLATVA